PDPVSMSPPTEVRSTVVKPKSPDSVPETSLDPAPSPVEAPREVLAPPVVEIPPTPQPEPQVGASVTAPPAPSTEAPQITQNTPAAQTVRTQQTTQSTPIPGGTGTLNPFHAGDPAVNPAGCATCGEHHSYIDGPSFHGACAGGSCIPGRPPCYLPA